MFPGTSPDLVAETLLWYFRDTSKRRAPMLHSIGATDNLDLVMRLALGRRVQFEAASFLGAGRAEELAIAAVSFIEHCLLDDEATHYQVLGIVPTASTEAICHNHRRLIQLVHPDRHNSTAAWPEKVAARINRAYSILKDPNTRAAYDLRKIDGRERRKSTRSAPSGALAPTTNGTFRRRKSRIVLPVSLTQEISMFVRLHPTATIFACLVALSLLGIGGVVLSQHDFRVVRAVKASSAVSEPVPAVPASNK